MNTHRLKSALMGLALLGPAACDECALGQQGKPWGAITINQLPPDSGISTLALSRDGSLLAIGTNSGVVRLWDLKHRKLVANPPLDSPPQKAASACLAFSDDGRLLASVDYGKTSSLRVWNLENGSIAWRVDGLKYGNKVAFAPDCKSLIILELSQARIFDATTGKPLRNFDIDPGFISYLAFSNDGSLIATAGFGFGHARVWDYATGQQKAKVVFGAALCSVAFMKGGEVLLVTSWNQPVKARELGNDKPVRDLTGPIVGYAGLYVSEACNILVTQGNGKLTFWGLDDGKPVLEADVRGSGVLASDGRTFAIGGRDNTVTIWDLNLLRKKQ